MPDACAAIFWGCAAPVNRCSNIAISKLLGADGPVAELLTGFAPRAEQQYLSQAVHDTLESGDILIGEAGTGTGKTFAYLLPALLSDKRVVISTGTRHLQEQLYNNDLPLIRRALRSSASACLLKGRANYLCRHRLERARQHPALLDASSQKHLRIITEWAGRTRHGDITEVTGVPEDAIVWSFVVSNQDFCSQHEPEELSDCFIHKARRRAQDSDLIVVNHHVLCADLALKDQGFGELLPSVDCFIIDEAHQMPDVAAQFFGQRLSSRQLLELARDTVGEQIQEAPDCRELRDLAQELESAVSRFRLAFAIEPERGAWKDQRDKPAMQRELERLSLLLGSLDEVLSEMAERGKGLESCYQRSVIQKRSLEHFTGESEASQSVHWYETFRTGFSLNMTPLNVAEPFARARNALSAGWVFTSATLAVGGDFSHFRDQLGLTDAQEIQVDSPFDYCRNALLYLPDSLPEPQSRDYIASLVTMIEPVLQASAGRAFLLFTSYRAMHEAESLLTDRLDYPLLVQGQMPRYDLIDAFQTSGRAVLLGTSSFWEGVDVRGDALSLVVIDKLPFGSPGDPVLSARIDHMRRAGDNPFYDHQIPKAAIALKQGVGRLIRDVTDRGVLVLCDPRIRSRDYGEIFITSLPPMPITRDLTEVQQFFDTQAVPSERFQKHDYEPAGS